MKLWFDEFVWFLRGIDDVGVEKIIVWYGGDFVIFGDEFGLILIDFVYFIIVDVFFF